MTLTHDYSTTSGNLAASSGTLLDDGRAEGRRSRADDGGPVHVGRRQKNGKWMYVVDHASLPMPPPAAPTAAPTPVARTETARGAAERRLRVHFALANLLRGAARARTSSSRTASSSRTEPAPGRAGPPRAVAVLVELASPRSRATPGGIAGLPATAPDETGHHALLAARREEVARYRDYLDARQDDLFERPARAFRRRRSARPLSDRLQRFRRLVPAGSVRELAKLPGVAAVHAVREYFPTLDASNAAMGAPGVLVRARRRRPGRRGNEDRDHRHRSRFLEPDVLRPALSPPAGFPKGDATLANGKVIVARFFQSAGRLASDANAEPRPPHRSGPRRARLALRRGRRGRPASTSPARAAARSRSPASRRRPGSATTVSSRRARSTTTSSRRSRPRCEDGMDVINMSFGSDPGR